MPRILIVAISLILGKFCHSQASVHYADLPEGDFKTEMSLFVKSAGIGKTIDNSDKRLSEIKLKRCSGDFAYFESGDIIAIDKLVNISSKPVTLTGDKILENQGWGKGNGNPLTEIGEVQYIHAKFQLILPDSAIAGLYNPRFCINHNSKNKIRKSTRTDCRVYQSADKRRVYIYMLNGAPEDQYEVTWVIKDGMYSMRVIDKVF